MMYFTAMETPTETLVLSFWQPSPRRLLDPYRYQLKKANACTLAQASLHGICTEHAGNTAFLCTVAHPSSCTHEAEARGSNVQNSPRLAWGNVDSASESNLEVKWGSRDSGSVIRCLLCMREHRNNIVWLWKPKCNCGIRRVGSLSPGEFWGNVVSRTMVFAHGTLPHLKATPGHLKV